MNRDSNRPPKPPARPDDDNTKVVSLRQMHAGAVHNIGNIVTVARLATDDFEETHIDTCRSLLAYILGELLPQLGEVCDGGCEVGEQHQEYVRSLRELLEHQNRQLDDASRDIRAIRQKLTHLVELVHLQQRMLSGLGTTEEVQLADLARDATTMLAQSAARHGVQLLCEDGNVPNVRVDPAMVTQVLINLVKNSIEALDRARDREGRVVVRTLICPDCGPGLVCCEVEDNGPGIPDEHLERIFDFGYSTKIERSPGTGLGLHFCRRALEHSGGAIVAQSREGQGAVFHMRLPRA